MKVEALIQSSKSCRGFSSRELTPCDKRISCTTPQESAATADKGPFFLSILAGDNKICQCKSKR